LAVLLNAESARWRRNLDLAHELFHLLTWDIFRSENDAALDMPPEKEEKLATCFAGRVLMPDDVTRDAVQGAVQGGKLTLEALFDVARQFDVSVEALLWRMHFIFNRSEEQTKADIERSRGCAALFEDRESDQPPERPARYWALALKALRQGRISQGTFAAYVGISRKEAERYLEPERAGDEEIAFAPA
jgi:Zn-dependent peptidase ImmA (M78 family)